MRASALQLRFRRDRDTRFHVVCAYSAARSATACCHPPGSESVQNWAASLTRLRSCFLPSGAGRSDGSRHRGLMTLGNGGFRRSSHSLSQISKGAELPVICFRYACPMARPTVVSSNCSSGVLFHSSKSVLTSGIRVISSVVISCSVIIPASDSSSKSCWLIPSAKASSLMLASDRAFICRFLELRRHGMNISGLPLCSRRLVGILAAVKPFVKKPNEPEENIVSQPAVESVDRSGAR